MNPRTILFIHQAFPGQFSELAQSLVADGHKVYALAMNPQAQLPGVTLIKYSPIRTQNTEGMPYLLQELDSKVLRGESAFKALVLMRERGLNPDVVYAHPGWGEALFVKDVWPTARLVVYAEWFYSATGQEVDFDPEFPPISTEETQRLRLKNMPFLHALSEADAAISPTNWQKSRFPAWAQDKITVIHDGLHLREIADVMPKTLGMPSSGLKLRKGMPIITYVARHLEPVRGFHVFMRSLPAILRANPDAHVIIMGRDAGINNQGYGHGNSAGSTWRKTLEAELGNSLDANRVHFLGSVSRTVYLAMLRLSACHVYLTTPFILSWSFLEAAAMGLPIVASDTAPVREFAHLDGLELVKFGDPEALAATVLQRLRAMDEATISNAEPLRDFALSSSLSRIKAVLLTGSRAFDAGSVVEEVVVLEDDTPSEVDNTTVNESTLHAKKEKRTRKRNASL